MQLSLARRLSSVRTINQGACLLSVVLSMRSRAFEYVVPLSIGFHVHRAELPLAQRVIDAGQKAPLLFFLSDFKPYLDQDDAAVDNEFFDLRAKFQEAIALLLGGKTHDGLNAGAIVPTAIEDNDLAAGWKLFDVTLNIHLAPLPLGGRRQSHDTENARADPLGERFDRAALTGGVSPFERDDDLQAFMLDPILQAAKLDLKFP